MNKKVIIIVSLVFLVLVILSFNKILINKVDLKLISNKKISLNIGDLWKDPGYIVSNTKYQDNVEVNSNLDLNKEGSYKIDYVLKVGLFSKIVTREINVLPKNSPSDMIVKVNGDNPYYLINNKEYQEQGIKVTDINEGNITNQVIITNNINEQVVGNYEVVYEITNKAGITKKIVRDVIVYSFNFTGKVKNTTYSKDNEIIIDISDKQYNYTQLPNNGISSKRNISYPVYENGLYTFTIYDNSNNALVYNVNIDTIDKDEPTGTCLLSLSDIGGTISVNAKDNGEIDGYEYVYGLNKTKLLTDKEYVINTLDDKASVTVYDKAGNSKTISCSTLDKSTSYPRSYSLKTYTYNGKEWQYWLYTPKNSKRNKIPLVVYFHGDGGRANPKGVNLYGLPKYIAAGDDYPFYMAAPYCSNEIDFSHDTYMAFVMDLINYLSNTYSIDKDRIIMSGGSSGARGAYTITAKYKQFSCLVIISGITYQLYKDKEQNLTYLPIWVFHGKNDQAVMYSEVKKHVENINSYGGNAKLTTYDGGHDSTDQAFENKAVIEWMISQKRKG